MNGSLGVSMGAVRVKLCKISLTQYYDRQFNETGQKIIHFVKTGVSIIYLQLNFDETQNYYLTQTMGFFSIN